MGDEPVREQGETNRREIQLCPLQEPRPPGPVHRARPDAGARGAHGARQLADWGANVIKVELPAHLDTGEALGGARDGPDFQNLHRNKRAIELDLKSPAGVEVKRRLAAKADVVVENFRPDVKKRLGIDYAALSKVAKHELNE